MYDDGINNDFEAAHQKGLRRGFDLGWSYKGRFDRILIEDEIAKLQKELKTNKAKQALRTKIRTLQEILILLKNHKSNKEHITIGSW